MTKKAIYCLIAIAVFLTLASSCRPAAAEQVERDMFAAVVVNPSFTMSLDNANIDFGYVESGNSSELKPGTYYNSVTCNSNKGKTWYLKVSIMGEVAGPTPDLSLDSFKSKVYSVIGDGTPKDGWQPFAAEPQTIYTSGGRDDTGETVVIRFQYKLDLPPSAVGGYYKTKVLYTMTDVP